MNIKNWRLNQGHKVALFSAAFLLMAISAAKVSNDNQLKANDLLPSNEVHEEDMGCYHTVRSTGELIKCGPNGCFHMDGRVFEKTLENESDVEYEICRNEDSSERTFDDFMPHPEPYFDDDRFEDDRHFDDGRDFDDDRFEDGRSDDRNFDDDRFDDDRHFDDGRDFDDDRYDDGRSEDRNFDDDRFEDDRHFDDDRFDDDRHFDDGRSDDGKQFEDNRYAPNNERESMRMERELMRVEREIKRFERQLERAKGKGFEVGKMEDMLGKARAKVEEARGFIGNMDFEQFWWAIEDARELMDFELRELIENLERGYHMQRWVKDTGRMLKEMTREVERLEKHGKAIPESYGKLKETFARAENYYNNGDFENAQWSLEDFQDIAWNFWDSLEEFHRGDFEDDLRNRGGDMVMDIERGLEDADQMIRKFEAEGKDVSRLKELLRKAEELLNELRKAVDKDDGNQIEEILDKLEFGLKEEFEREMMRLDGGRRDGAWDDAYKPDDVVRHFNMDSKDAEQIMERMMEKMSQKLMAKLMAKGLPPTVMEELMQSGFEDEVQRTLEGVGYMDKGATEIINNKVAILEKVKDIDTQIADLQKKKRIALQKLDELKYVKERIANYNFASETGTEIKTKIDEFIQTTQESGVSKDEIEKGIADLKKEAEGVFKKAKEEKFNKGIIPFKDTDDNEWYTQFASEAKNQGLVKGTGVSGGTEFNPAGITNLAEAMAMFGRAIGADSDGNPSSGVGKRLPDWAQGAAAALETKGVNLDEIFGGKQAGESVTRAEVARLLMQVFSLATGDASHFADIADANTAEKDAIGAVNRAGMMTGEGGTDRFNVKGPLNRAALVKILSIASGR